MRLSLLATRIVRRRRAGLTLMELVVVMVILIALAGILLPLFPSMLTRAHTSSAATNMSELSKSVQAYYYQDLQLPNNLDNIAAITGVASPTNPAVPSIVPAGASTDLTTATLAANDLAALQAGGMNYSLVLPAPPAGTNAFWSPTYSPYSTTKAIGATFLPSNLTTNTTVPGVSTPLAGQTVVYVAPAAAARELAQPLTGVYVLFGVGDYSSLTGTVLQQAPIHFDDASAGEPNSSYCRFGLVFQTTADGTYADLPSARFVGAVDLGDAGGITSVQDHIQGYLNTK